MNSNLNFHHSLPIQNRLGHAISVDFNNPEPISEYRSDINE